MKHLLYILTFFCFTVVLGQNRELNIKRDSNGDTSLWYKWRMELSNHIELDTLSVSENKWHFRLWTNKQTIDIWGNSKGIITGKLTSWTKEYSKNDKHPSNHVFYEKKLLDSVQVYSMISLIDSTQVNSIPDQDSIEEWGLGFDGITYIIESVAPSVYHFKTYWTPDAQDSLSEAIIIQHFVDRSLTITNAYEVWADFKTRIPFECYRNGGPMITCKMLTRKERRKLRRKR